MKYCDACKTSYPNDFAVCPRDQSTLRTTTELMQGTTVRNKYQILEKIGVGGMATVYKAKHLTFGEIRALKVVASKLLDDELFMKRFKTEAIVTRKLKHPNAVRVDDFDETEDGRPFIVMEYVEGKNLRHVVHTEKKLALERALHIGRQVAEALSAAHAIGITHRDIKPDNILLVVQPDGSEQAKVLDFGIAKLREGSIDQTSYTPTQTGMVMGTPQYISPEQALGRTGDEVDGRADIYSLGVVLYEMLCGELPFRSDTPIGLLMHHIHTIPTPPQTLQPDLPPAISELLLKCLEKDRTRRYQSADELLEALSRPEISATTAMLGSTTLGSTSEARAAGAATSAMTPPRPLATTPSAAAAKLAAAVATPPGTPTPATAPLTPVKVPTPPSVATPAATTPSGLPTPPIAPPVNPPWPRPRLNVPIVRTEAKSHKGLYAIVGATSLIVIVLVTYAVFRPKPEADTVALQPAAQVQAQIQRLLDSSPVLQKHHLTVSYEGGVATLYGTVDTQSDSELAQALTTNVPGVNAVSNRLAIQPGDTPAEEGQTPAPQEQHPAETGAKPEAQQQIAIHEGKKSEPATASHAQLPPGDNAEPVEPIEDDVSAAKEQRVHNLIAAGYRDMNSQPPKGRKAYMEFNKALELDPGNKQALAGIQRLEMMRRQMQQRRLQQPPNN
jgi:serine/threonine protein kinase